HSWSVISDLADRYTWVRGINLMRNYGQHNALLCGIREANHDVIVTMDDDLQHRRKRSRGCSKNWAGGSTWFTGRRRGNNTGSGGTRLHKPPSWCCKARWAPRLPGASPHSASSAP